MRVRFRFTKTGKVRWTSHRDVARMWERALRRAGLPVTYTAGFTPRPKISFGLALPTGHESVAEYLDVEFEEDLDVGGLPALLTPALPTGLEVTAAAEVGRIAGSLQESVTSCMWEVEAVGDTDGLIERALAAPELIITRTRKGTDLSEDVRPSILSAMVIGPPPCAADGFVDHVPGALIRTELATHPRGLRPAEFLAALSVGAHAPLREGHVRRTQQWIERDGARWEPLPLGATNAPHVEARAS
jgi:radical SAM-linked protein